MLLREKYTAPATVGGHFMSNGRWVVMSGRICT
jgi:hypothetical protein